MTGCGDGKAGHCHGRDSVGHGLCAFQGAGHLYPVTRVGQGENLLICARSWCLEFRRHSSSTSLHKCRIGPKLCQLTVSNHHIPIVCIGGEAPETTCNSTLSAKFHVTRGDSLAGGGKSKSGTCSPEVCNLVPTRFPLMRKQFANLHTLHDLGKEEHLG